MKIYWKVLFCLCIISAVGKAQNIVSGEYFFDTDPGFGNAVAFSTAPAPDGDFPFTVNTASAATGFHKLYIRTKDNNGKWSHTIRKEVEILPTQSAANLVAGEYFLDTDPGVGNGKAFTTNAATDGDFPFTVNPAPASTGFHKLYIRTRDSNGKWSHTVRKDIEVLPVQLMPDIVSGEYFVDVDPGIGSGTAFAVTAATDGAFPLSVSVTGLLNGYHKLYVRTKDENGKWGLTARKDIELLAAAPPFTITSGEYFFDTDPGIGNGISFSFNPADTSVAKTFDVAIGCTDVSFTHQIFFRVKDNKGDWSSTASNSFLPKATTTVTTVSSGLWSSPSTWSNGQLPGPGSTVILNHNIVVDIDAACYLLRTNCKNMTVSTGKKLTITGH